MAGFFRQEQIAAFADDASLVCIAIDRSSNSDRSYYYQKIVDARTLYETPLGRMALSPNRAGSGVPYFIPFFASGSPAAPFVALLFLINYPDMVLHIIDTQAQAIVVEHRFPRTHTVQLNEKGSLYLLASHSHYACFRVEKGAPPVFQSRIVPEHDFLNQCVWCAGRWCLFQRSKTVWNLLLVDETSGVVVDTIRLHGRPGSISAARTEPVVVCGLARNRLQIINLDTKTSALIHYPGSDERNNGVDVAMAPDGRRLVVRGSLDQTLWAMACGQEQLTALGPLPQITLPMHEHHFMISTPAFCLLNDRCLVLQNGVITSITEQLPSASTASW